MMPRRTTPTFPPFARVMSYGPVHFLAWFLMGVAAATVAVAEETKTAANEPAAVSRGETIYQQLCVKCHGPAGEGSSEYKEPLVGDLSMVELARVIDETMPQSDPKLCQGDDAKAVAEYIFNAFYSPVAQIRRKPPRKELARLTVREHRESLAQIFECLRWAPDPKGEPGLKGEYFPNRRFNERKLERIDAAVDFNFGEGSPAADSGIPAEEFSIRWSGAVFALETGSYVFKLKTQSGAQLWVNDRERPLIDGRVRSGVDAELDGTISLLGGRWYYVRLETFKSKEAKEKQAGLTLRWQPPHRVEQTITSRNLSTRNVSEVYVAATAFPPDDRTYGYERGAAANREWDDATTEAALETSEYALKRLREFAGFKREDSDEARAEKLKRFAGRFVTIAWRQPPADAIERAVNAAFEGVASPEDGVKRAVLLALKSPRFLYREPDGAPDEWRNVASRMSFALWDSGPDESLRKVIERNEFKNNWQFRHQIDRMTADLKTQAKLFSFLQQWLRVDHLTDIAKSSSAYPDFTPQVVSDLRESLDLQLRAIVENESATLNDLLLDERVFLNGRLAALYGVESSAGDAFVPVRLDDGVRAGVITHPFLMAGFAYSASTAPIHRGVFVARSLLGRGIKTPPIAVAPLAPDLHPDLTTRERTMLQTQPPVCMSCHAMINPLGFPMERFDAIGRLRQTEKEKPIDDHGEYVDRLGQYHEFRGPRELAGFLAASDEVRTAFIQQLFQYLAKQQLAAFEPEAAAGLRAKFTESNGNIRRLIAEIAAVAAQPPATPAK